MQKFYKLAVLLLAVALLAANGAWAASNSRYVSDTLPTAMSSGITYTATVTTQNTGDTTWTDGSVPGYGPVRIGTCGCGQTKAPPSPNNWIDLWMPGNTS